MSATTTTTVLFDTLEIGLLGGLAAQGEWTELLDTLYYDALL